MHESNLDIERAGPITRVWLNRPEKRNALDTTTLEEIIRVFGGFREDFETRVVVIAGRGPSFCAGADRGDPPGSARIAADSGASDRERRHAAQLGLRACRAIEDSEQLTIAEIHGHAIGGGLAIALSCDFRLAADDAFFQYPEIELGLPLTWGAVPRLIAEVGAARAREILLLCERFGASQAEHWGVVHRAVPISSLAATTSEWADRLAQKPEVAVHMTRTQLRGYSQNSRLGDLTETDGDLLLGASRSLAAQARFRSK
jgi:enoyl-CoA hydratase/carnithine racemase